jgi:hypothetical protein
MSIRSDIQLFGHQSVETIAQPRVGQRVIIHKWFEAEYAAALGNRLHFQRCIQNALTARWRGPRLPRQLLRFVAELIRQAKM